MRVIRKIGHGGLAHDNNRFDPELLMKYVDVVKAFEGDNHLCLCACVKVQGHTGIIDKKRSMTSLKRRHFFTGYLQPSDFFIYQYQHNQFFAL